jgi:hypothetical protein
VRGKGWGKREEAGRRGEKCPKHCMHLGIREIFKNGE